MVKKLLYIALIICLFLSGVIFINYQGGEEQLIKLDQPNHLIIGDEISKGKRGDYIFDLKWEQSVAQYDAEGQQKSKQELIAFGSLLLHRVDSQLYGGKIRLQSLLIDGKESSHLSKLLEEPVLINISGNNDIESIEPVQKVDSLAKVTLSQIFSLLLFSSDKNESQGKDMIGSYRDTFSSKDNALILTNRSYYGEGYFSRFMGEKERKKINNLSKLIDFEKNKLKRVEFKLDLDLLSDNINRESINFQQYGRLDRNREASQQKLDWQTILYPKTKRQIAPHYWYEYNIAKLKEELPPFYDFLDQLQANKYGTKVTDEIKFDFMNKLKKYFMANPELITEIPELLANNSYLSWMEGSMIAIISSLDNEAAEIALVKIIEGESQSNYAREHAIFSANSFTKYNENLYTSIKEMAIGNEEKNLSSIALLAMGNIYQKQPLMKVTEIKNILVEQLNAGNEETSEIAIKAMINTHDEHFYDDIVAYSNSLVIPPINVISALDQINSERAKTTILDWLSEIKKPNDKYDYIENISIAKKDKDLSNEIWLKVERDSNLEEEIKNDIKDLLRISE